MDLSIIFALNRLRKFCFVVFYELYSLSHECQTKGDTRCLTGKEGHPEVDSFAFVNGRDKLSHSVRDEGLIVC